MSLNVTLVRVQVLVCGDVSTARFGVHAELQQRLHRQRQPVLHLRRRSSAVHARYDSLRGATDCVESDTSVWGTGFALG